MEYVEMYLIGYPFISVTEVSLCIIIIITQRRKQIIHGVPQGSIMWPLLFIIHIHDFSRCSDLLFSI